MEKSKEYIAVEKARLQYDGESCEYSKQRLKKFILTQCNKLEQKGIVCAELYLDLIEGTGVNLIINSNKMMVTIEEAELQRLESSDRKLVESQRDIKNLKTQIKNLENRVENLKTKVSSQKIKIYVLTDKIKTTQDK